MKKIVVPLSVDGIDRLQKELKKYQAWQQEKAKELAERLADFGVNVAKVRFSRGSYLGDRDENVAAEPIPNGFVVKASGKSVFFIEFGTGITYGFGHPEAQEYRMGPGTYPEGKGHWDDAKGWYLPKEKGGMHTYGNPPAMPMYEARKAIEQELPRIVREVFSGD